METLLEVRGKLNASDFLSFYVKDDGYMQRRNVGEELLHSTLSLSIRVVAFDGDACM